MKAKPIAGGMKHPTDDHFGGGVFAFDLAHEIAASLGRQTINHASRAPDGEFGWNEHMNPVVPTRPVNQKGRVGVFLRPATQFDGLVPQDLHPIRSRLRFE